MLPAQSKYPKKIHVGDDTYKIIFKKMQHYGETDSNAKTISIKKGMSPRATFVTFLHELLHAIEFTHGIKIKHKTIYELEKAFYELLVDNFI